MVKEGKSKVYGRSTDGPESIRLDIDYSYISDVHPDAILKVLNDSCQKSPYGDPIKQEKIKRKSAAASALGHPVRRTSPSRARRCASHLRENNENIRRSQAARSGSRTSGSSGNTTTK